MSFNKEELSIWIEVLKNLLPKCDTHGKIALERIINKFKSLLKMIETGGME